MPRFKPKAQRLAPPLSTSTSEFETYGPPSITNDTGGLDSASALGTERNVSKPNNADSSRRELKNPAKKRRRCTSQEEILPASLSNPSRLDSGIAPAVVKGSLPAESIVGTNGKSKKRRKIHDTAQWSASQPQQSPTRDSSGRMFGLRSSILDRHGDVRGTSSDIGGRLSPQASCVSTDTASVGLAEDIPQPEVLEEMAYVPVGNEASESYDHRNYQSARRTSNGRFANNSFRRTGNFPRVSGSSRTRKSVEADPTPPSVLPALGELPRHSQIGTVVRSERHKFSFLSDDEAKSVFDRGASKVNNGNARHPQRKANKEKLHDYWKELETVSIRNCSLAEKIGEKGRLNGKKSTTNGVPSLHSFEHPITEENLDGGDAILVGKSRKKKSGKKAKSGSDLVGSAAEHDTQAHAFGQRMSKESKRKKSSTSGEAVNRGRDGEDTASSTGFSEADGQACMECGSHGKASKMVLCDACSDGCHTFCMRPARTGVPLGVWVCPRCHMVAKKHEVHLSKLSTFLENHGQRM